MTEKSAQAYPLAWPRAIPRTKIRIESRFKVASVAAALTALKRELAKLGAFYIVVSTNVPLKANGDPYSDPGKMPDPGCAVYFQLNGKPYCLPCDRWLWVEENLYAVAKHIEAMRGMERWGVGSIEQQFAGFKELPSSTGEGEDPFAVLCLKLNASAEEIKGAHRKLAQTAHSDVGGSDDQMARINMARDKALAAKAGA